jgi:hypothetical protein
MPPKPKPKVRWLRSRQIECAFDLPRVLHRQVFRRVWAEGVCDMHATDVRLVRYRQPPVDDLKKKPKLLRMS